MTLKGSGPGLHRLEVADAGAGTAVAWPEGTPLAALSSFDNPLQVTGRWSLYFYVPKGTKVVGGYMTGPGALLDGSGKKAHAFDGKPGYFSVPVAPGQDGKLWKFDRAAGRAILMTVPHYFARSAGELLLPAEVLEKDRMK